MYRTIPFDEDEICDICGKKGAYDFMGDCICPECLGEDPTWPRRERKG